MAGFIDIACNFTHPSFAENLDQVLEDANDVDVNKFGGIYNTDPAGEGGQASVKQENPANYLLEVPFGTTMTITIGNGGAGASDGGTDGGNGAGGYVKINIDGTEYEYTVVGTHTETL